MKATTAKKRPARAARAESSSHSSSNGKVYLEIPLDGATLRSVKALARVSGSSPFEVCVRLLNEQLFAS